MASGTHPYLRVRRGQSPLERRAIEAHALRLGLRVCRETRTVLAPGRARGGFEALKSAARLSGNARVLGLDALSSVPARRRLVDLLGLSPPAEAKARTRLAKASASSTRAANGLRAISERYILTAQFDRRHLLAVAHEMSASVESLRAALEPAVLGYATPVDLEQINRAYTEYLSTCGRYRRTFSDLITHAFPEGESRILWLGKDRTLGANDPLEAPSQRALASIGALIDLGELFVRRAASHLTGARNSPRRAISDSSRSLPST